MISRLHHASALAGAALVIASFVGAEGSNAFAQDKLPDPANGQVLLPVSSDIPPLDAPSAAVAPDAAPSPASLDALVSAQPEPADLSPELRCLAGAVYFEAKSESLAGQLAVADVVINRARSGRFPASYCGVVYQPSQFSFIRGRSMPAINPSSQDWREAVAIARIADRGAWRSPVQGALFFHAARVSPGWRLTRVARVDNHVFYR